MYRSDEYHAGPLIQKAAHDPYQPQDRSSPPPDPGFRLRTWLSRLLWSGHRFFGRNGLLTA